MQETQSTRVGHCKRDSTDVYIGRGPEQRDLSETPIGERGWLGNPYTLETHTREESIAKYREAFEAKLSADDKFRKAVADLHGQTLGCWCQRIDEGEPACHGEVIAEWADKLGGSGNE